MRDPVVDRMMTQIEYLAKHPSPEKEKEVMAEFGLYAMWAEARREELKSCQEALSSCEGDWLKLKTENEKLVKCLLKQPEPGEVLDASSVRRALISDGLSSDHAAIAAGRMAEYAMQAYKEGFGRGFTEGHNWRGRPCNECDPLNNKHLKAL